MKELFRISTELVSLDWTRVSPEQPAILATNAALVGHFKVTPRSATTRLLDDTRKALPQEISDRTDIEIGPALFEETDYQVYLRAKNPGDTIEFQHRDPLMRRRLSSQEQGSVLHGVLNFRGQIGRSRFTILVNGTPEVDFEVEVFPTKVDYESDYKEILADVQEVLTSLAYEYLRSTFQLGKSVSTSKPSRLEWLILLRQIMEDLDQAVRHIIQQPQRRLVRRPRTTRIERIKRVDSAVRSQVRRGLGRGQLLQTTAGPIRERLVEYPHESTMDTMEHRWIKRQLTDIQRTLAQILAAYKQQEGSDRQRAALRELTKMERRVSRLSQAEPFREANGDVPAGFASLQLVSAPGYRETFQLCMLLKMGLRLEGEAFRLSVKDLNVLYEYWVFLAIVKIIRDEYGSPEDLSKLFQIRKSGVGIRLITGRGQSVPFRTGKNRRVEVIYNPQFDDHDTTLIPQKPDILMRFEEEGWPRIQLICDAKYRIDATEEYCNQFKSYGPPRDAINVLHRYRDAILELDKKGRKDEKPKRSVIQAAALFPYTERKAGEFRESRLWQSIERLGIGAIPALPSSLGYLREWLTTAIHEGGWSLADRVIPHMAEQRAVDWRVAASEPVLVGVIPSKTASQRLEWITENQIYYHPLPKAPHRHFRVAAVALYSSKTNREAGAITHQADVNSIEVLPRKEIGTPWQSRWNADEEMLVYHLTPLIRRPHAIVNHGDDATTFRKDRWTSRLALDRAKTAQEILLETAPEWKLYEMLQARQIIFKLRADRVRLERLDEPTGRAWFVLSKDKKIRYDGKNGFLIVNDNSGREEYHGLAEVSSLLMASHA